MQLIKHKSTLKIFYKSPNVCNDFTINKINEYLSYDDDFIENINKSQADTNINTFSNILDVKSVNIDDLINSLEQIENDYNFFICNSPSINDYTRMQLNNFYNNFIGSEVIQTNSTYSTIGQEYWFRNYENRNITNKEYRYRGFIFSTESEG